MKLHLLGALHGVVLAARIGSAHWQRALDFVLRPCASSVTNFYIWITLMVVCLHCTALFETSSVVTGLSDATNVSFVAILLRSTDSTHKPPHPTAMRKACVCVTFVLLSGSARFILPDIGQQHCSFYRSRTAIGLLRRHL